MHSPRAVERDGLSSPEADMGKGLICAWSSIVRLSQGLGGGRGIHTGMLEGSTTVSRECKSTSVRLSASNFTRGRFYFDGGGRFCH